MDFHNFLTSLLGGAVSAVSVTTLLITFFKEKWIETIRADHAKDLESFKDQLLRQQKQLDTHNAHRVFVTKTQFDAEFSAMQDIYASATKVFQALEILRPMFDFLPDDKQDREKEVHERWKNLVLAFNPFSTQIEALGPFYPVELYEELVKCRKFASIEINQIRTNFENALSTSGYLQASKNQTEFNNAYRTVATLIRRRLENSSVSIPT